MLFRSCEELNGPDYVAIPYEPDGNNPNSVMDVGYIVKNNAILSGPGQRFLAEIRKYLKIGEI